MRSDRIESNVLAIEITLVNYCTLILNQSIVMIDGVVSNVWIYYGIKNVQPFF